VSVPKHLYTAFAAALLAFGSKDTKLNKNSLSEKHDFIFYNIFWVVRKSGVLSIIVTILQLTTIFRLPWPLQTKNPFFEANRPIMCTAPNYSALQFYV